MPDTSPTTLVLEGGTVLAGSELEARRVTVVIEDGKIRSLEPREAGADPPGGRVIDVSGLTLLPGFIDAHVHIEFYDPREVLVGGVTTVRDLAWPPERIFPLSEASRRAGFDGPEILTAGPMLTAPGGYPMDAGWAPPGTGREIRKADEGVRAVDELADAGVSVIKVALNEAAGPTLPADVLSAIVRRAHERGLKVTGHVTGIAELDKAIAVGVDELAHMLKGLDRIPGAALAQMVSQDMTVVPTLAPLDGAELAIATDNLARFIAAGGRVVYGTDLGDLGPKPGIDPLETERMGVAGMTLLDIVASATTRSAEWLGLEDRGVIEVGMRADIVGIEDELSIESLPNPALVIRAGSLVKAP